jgi:hypothetical protein
MDQGAVVDLFGRRPSRVRELVSDRASTLLTGSAADRPGNGIVVCRGCGSSATLGTVEVCLWWPFGCVTRDSEPCPRLCWDCCDEDEQCDLVDAGCPVAAWRRSGWPDEASRRLQLPAPPAAPGRAARSWDRSHTSTGGLVRVPGRS